MSISSTFASKTCSNLCCAIRLNCTSPHSPWQQVVHTALFYPPTCLEKPTKSAVHHSRPLRIRPVDSLVITLNELATITDQAGATCKASRSSHRCALLTCCQLPDTAERPLQWLRPPFDEATLQTSGQGSQQNPRCTITSRAQNFSQHTPPLCTRP